MNKGEHVPLRVSATVLSICLLCSMLFFPNLLFDKLRFIYLHFTLHTLLYSLAIGFADGLLWKVLALSLLLCVPWLAFSCVKIARGKMHYCWTPLFLLAVDMIVDIFRSSDNEMVCMPVRLGFLLGGIIFYGVCITKNRNANRRTSGAAEVGETAD